MRIFCAVSLAILVTALPAAAATLTGTVSLVADGKARPDASNAVVWLEGAPRTGIGPSKASMKQVSKRFQPPVVVVEKNATVDFPNDDPIYHNVFSVSGGNRFDLGLYRGGSSKSKKFEEVGIVRVYCNIHPQMVGFVVVVDSDHVAITGRDGAFRFDDVPPGSYVLKAWHEESGETSQPVVVRGAGDPPAAVSLDVTGFKPEAHKNKYGKDYPPNAAASSDERY
ncbi:MAG TPA: carboxypeptidase regulatory-like domain-containing protein [Thermoanaerobaculia bacterium]|nr:carboxypeptidase regulatory-like domain-containing protein [Thermoanaerobaculia bacterium]